MFVSHSHIVLNDTRCTNQWPCEIGRLLLVRFLDVHLGMIMYRLTGQSYSIQHQLKTHYKGELLDVCKTK